MFGGAPVEASPESPVPLTISSPDAIRMFPFLTEGVTEYIALPGAVGDPYLLARTATFLAFAGGQAEVGFF